METHSQVAQKVEGGITHENNEEGQSTAPIPSPSSLVRRTSYRSSGTVSNHVLRGVGSISVQEMREHIRRLYGTSWQRKVDAMADNQVIAIYRRWEETQKPKQQRPERQIKTNKRVVIQLNLFTK